jgi:5-methylcytosine-specific restriction endonuclease McrA
MPCSQRKARILLKEDKARIIGYKPFAIQLTVPTGESTQEVHLGVDTGAKHIGIAATSENKVLAKGEIELRDDIHKNMQIRSALRRDRRNRNTRYREARFLNRKRKDGWLPPTVQSKLDATFMWIDKFCNLLPSPILHIEVGKFDMQKMMNPDITNEEYQNGQCAGYFDVRYFVFARDNYTCQVCKKKNKILCTHHLLYKSKGGSDRADNLITVCIDCHSSENHKEGGILYDWMVKHKKVKQYKEATFMNIVRKRTFQKYPNAIITYGSETSPYRKELGLEKSHYNDAIAISKIKNIMENPKEYFYIRQFRKKKRSLHESIPTRGRRKKKNINAERRNKNSPYRVGWFMNDMVSFQNKVGWIYGFSGGESGKECVLRDINGEIIRDSKRSKNNPNVKFSSLKFICHNNNWQYKIIC